MKSLKESIKLLEDIMNQRVELEDEEGADWDYENVREYIKSKLGFSPASYSGSADWGGIIVFPLGDSNYVGTFVVIDDNDDVVLLTRKHNEITDEYEDDIIRTANNWEDLAEMMKGLKK